MHFYITWVIFQQFSRRDVKLLAFLIIFHLLNYTSPLILKHYGKMKKKINLLWSGINTKKWVFVVPYHISWQRIAICCVVTVDHGHFSCRYNSRIGFLIQNVYVNKLNIVLLYAFCSVLTNSNTDIMQVICTEWHMMMVGDEDCQWW